MNVNKVKVLSNVQVSARYWHMKVDAPVLVHQTEPGQFYNMKCSEDSGLPFLRRPFSIYRINKDEGTLEFLYLVKGSGTQELTNVEKDDVVDIFGPLGKGFTVEPEWKKILLVARGVGIATLAALAQEAANNNIKCVAILSARSRDDLLAADTLQGFGAEVYKVTEEEGTSDVPNVHHLINNILTEHKMDATFTCGSKRLSKLVQYISKENNIPGQIALEEHMGCAMGVCYACVCDIVENNQVKSVRVCKEGPVFELDKVVLL